MIFSQGQERSKTTVAFTKEFRAASPRSRTAFSECVTTVNWNKGEIFLLKKGTKDLSETNRISMI